MPKIFVFGSNEQGIHGAGAAAYAYKNHGAIMRRGFGIQGYSWAIPTKDWNIKPLKLEEVQHYINRFLVFAELQPTWEFQLTPIGCGLAGFEVQEIAPMFVNAGVNVLLPDPEFDSLSREFTELVLKLREENAIRDSE